MFGRLAGYEDMNDADRLCRDPAMRWVVGDRAIIGSAASASQMGRFETKWLSRPENLAVLAGLPGQWIDKVHQRRPPRIVAHDMDSSESPTYGEQEGSAYKGSLHESALSVRHLGRSMNGLRAGMSAPPLGLSRTAAVDRDCVKTQAFNLRVENLS